MFPLPVTFICYIVLQYSVKLDFMCRRKQIGGVFIHLLIILTTFPVKGRTGAGVNAPVHPGVHPGQVASLSQG